ncbi:Aste57867_1975 [Aphanomyces stellatus]|uniref:Aste57867_1975 protein n=1 Tax=Aphanomyces stellatus TaxID=120398 RepID=A0A485KBM6_9STRA|nr:hypothetical protein As57867_001973 [Aphanomyces stellatus]VFT79180.1 Aste57867_1975 [Aphanomyces stellatus]
MQWLMQQPLPRDPSRLFLDAVYAAAASHQLEMLQWFVDTGRVSLDMSTLGRVLTAASSAPMWARQPEKRQQMFEYLESLLTMAAANDAPTTPDDLVDHRGSIVYPSWDPPF